jgi:hypothetical protein
MLLDADILEVWCELLDDITIVRNQAGQEEFEFVQVKSNKLNQLWSVAKLCERDQKNPGTSILEKLFANERGAEPCRFRIVTCCDVNNELKLLTFRLDSPVRTAPNKDFTRLCQQVAKKIPDCKSPIGSDTSSWLSRTEWDIWYSEEAIREKSLSNLRAFGKVIGVFLPDNQWRDIYEKIYSKVEKAGEAKWKINLDAKKFKRDKFLDWVIPLIKLSDVPENLPRSGIKQLVGREQTLEELHQQLQEDGAVSVIKGMRGVGKTELALQYALKYKRTYPGGICWLDTRENVPSQIVKFARSRLQLDIPKDISDPAEQVGFCWGHWHLPGKVLVVLDDVNNFGEVKPYLPTQNERFRVVITTHWNFDDLPFSPLPLKELTEVLALQVLAQWIGAEQISCDAITKEDVASELCKRLGYLPLALHLVARYVKKRRIKLSEMLHRLAEKGLNHQALQVDESDRTGTMKIERGVAAAFELSWEELSESARRLGCSLSVCASTHTAYLLVKSVTEEQDIEFLEDANVELEDLHLIQEKETYQMHPLIRDFFQNKLDNADDLLLSIKQKVNNFLSSDEELHDFLTWVTQKASSVDIICKPSDIRKFYFTLIHNFPLARWIAGELGSIPKIQGLDENIFNYDLAYEHLYEIYLDLSLIFALYSEDIEEFRRDLDGCRADSVRAPKLYQEIEKLKTKLPEEEIDFENFFDEDWQREKLLLEEKIWQENSQIWLNKLRYLIIKYRKIRLDWKFTPEQMTQLEHYYSANILLEDCLNSDCKVSQNIKDKLEAELLVPVERLREERV